ncbi:MAG: AraC family transcriptional regulator [bacterium]
MRCNLESARVTLVHCDTPFEILRGTYVQQRFAPHMHETYAIGVIERGAAKCRYRGEDVIHREGDVVTIEPDEVHTGEAADEFGWSYRMMYLPRELMARYGTLDGSQPHFARSGYTDPELAKDVARLHDFLETESDVLRQASMMTAVLHTVCERYAQRPLPADTRVPSAALSQVRDYLEAHFAQSVSLAELATLARVSPFHLIRQFRRRYGLPPYMFLELIRVQRAKAMLQQGARVSDVAFATGFSDQSHLTRRFKRVVGVPPGRYAKSYAGA